MKAIFIFASDDLQLRKIDGTNFLITPSTYRPSGIEITVKKQKYAYEVLTADGQPDLAFLREHSKRKFFVKYDPDDMTIVQLWRETATGLVYEATAQPYLTMHRGIQEQLPGERLAWEERNEANNDARRQMYAYTEEILDSEKRHPKEHGLNMPPMKGVGKKGKHVACNVRTKKKEPVLVEDIGQWQKEVSNAEPNEDYWNKY